MNFYAFHIGDYASATRHLSWDEDAAFRRLLDAYYVKEGPLPVDLRLIYRLISASTDSQREAVEIVLKEFFVQTPEGWRNKRCDEEISDKQAKSEKARESALASVRSRERRALAAKEANERLEQLSERSEKANEGSAPNPTPNIKIKTSPTVVGIAEMVEAGMTEETAVEFIALRKRKKAPLTPLSWQGHLSEAAKAGFTPEQAALKAIQRNWQAFDSEFIKPDQKLKAVDPNEHLFARSGR